VIRIILVLFISICLVDIKYIYARAVLSDEAVSYREKGYEAQQSGDIDTAISWYQKAVGLDPKYAAPHNDLGILFETKGWLDRAESEYKKALVIDPDYEKAHTNIALLYERKGEKEKAAFHWMKRYKLGRSGDLWTDEALLRLKKLDLLGDATEDQLKQDKKRQKEQDLKKEVQEEKIETPLQPAGLNRIEGRLKEIEKRIDSSIELEETNKDRLSKIEREILEESVKIEGVNEKLHKLDIEEKLKKLDNKLSKIKEEILEESVKIEGVNEKLHKIESDIVRKDKDMDIERSFLLLEDELAMEKMRGETLPEEEAIDSFTSGDISSDELEEAFYSAEEQLRKERR